MAEYFTEDMIYDTNWSPHNTMNNSTGIQAWWDAEHIPYNLAFDNTTFNQVKWSIVIFTALINDCHLYKGFVGMSLIIND